MRDYLQQLIQNQLELLVATLQSTALTCPFLGSHIRILKFVQAKEICLRKILRSAGCEQNLPRRNVMRVCLFFKIYCVLLLNTTCSTHRSQLTLSSAYSVTKSINQLTQHISVYWPLPY